MKISLIIPCYNVEKYLGECLDSVYDAAIKLPSAINAEKNLIEVICVDDGSTDRTGRMLDEFKMRVQESECNCSVVVIHQQNVGEGAARNAGLDAMTGDWFMFLDSDDLLRDGVFVDAICYLGNDTDLVRYRAMDFHIKSNLSWPVDEEIQKGTDLLVNLPALLADIGVCQLLYRRLRFGDLRFSKYTIGADMAYTAQCFSRAHNITDIGKFEYGYRLRASSMVHRPRTARMVGDSIDFMVEMFCAFRDSGKVVCDALGRRRGCMLLEERASDLLCRERSPEWDAVWCHWIDVLSDTFKMPFFSGWQKFVAAAICLTRSRVVAWFLCVCPYNLKRLGVHR